MALKRVGLLTGGGDCPGLNAVIRAVVWRADREGVEVMGIRRGWLGLLELEMEPLTRSAVSGILPKGGTILGSSRINPLVEPGDLERLRDNLERNRLDALIVAGGNGTLAAATELHDRGVPVIGLPKTIDNDLRGTDYSFGFDTAVSVVCDAIDRLHSTAESHQRVMVVEVMGRHTGWLAVFGGMAAGADLILIPEKPYRPDDVQALIEQRKLRGRTYSIIVVAEGASPVGEPPPAGVGGGTTSGAGFRLARDLEQRMDIETRVTVLGHTQRGGSPTAFDRILATRFGIRAVELATKGRFGVMTGLRGTRVLPVPLQEATAGPKTVELDKFEDAEVFFG